MTKKHHVVLVEDNVPDVILAQKALSVLLDVEVTICTSAEGAMGVLERIGADLVLLDLNLPKINGIELLRKLKGQPVLRKIPVIVVTSSSSEEDIEHAYDAGASGYLIKPLSLKEYREMVDTLGRYWFRVSKLPSR